MTADESFVFDPRDLIMPPYEKCEACGADKLGLLSVRGQRLIKRCKVCLGTQVLDLPPVKKALIYLDQHAVSHLAKALHPDTRDKYLEGNPATQDGFWRDAFAKLDRLHSLQLLACPESQIQRTESLMDSRLTEQLRTLYEHLSGDVSFISADEIQGGQISAAFKAWLDGVSPNHGDRTFPLRRDPDQWLDKLRLSVNMGLEDLEAADARALRDRRQLDPFFSAISNGAQLSWEEYYDGEVKHAPDLVASPHAQVMLKHVLEASGIPDERWAEKITDFGNSDELKRIPVLEIYMGILASYAVEIAGHRAKRPTRGMYFDLSGIASFLPYCDAIFIDRECNRWLRDAKAHGKADWPTRVFTIDTRDEFLAYLDEIERSAPSGHEDLVLRVYGDSFLKPFWELFEWRQASD